MSKSLNSLIGNVKRKYTPEDFNPFLAMEWIYQNCLHSGVGHTVLITGHTPRYKKDIIRAWKHVMVSEKIIGGTDPEPVLHNREFVTHTGTILRFEDYQDIPVHQMPFYESSKQSHIIALCSRYTSPDFRNVIREATANSRIYDFSENNIKRGVDT